MLPSGQDFTADQVPLLKEPESNGALDGANFTGFADKEFQSYEYDVSIGNSLKYSILNWECTALGTGLHT